MTGTTPSTTHSDARITIGARMDQPASCPAGTVWSRGMPRNTLPTTFTKQAQASAPMTASTGATSAPSRTA